MKKATREWVRKAESDYRLAEILDRGNEPFPDQLCFHCQQSAEKFLKALLDVLRPSYPVLRPLRRGLLFLTDFAVDTRYPGNWTTKRQAKAALRWARRVRQEARSLLGLRPPRKRSP